MNVFFLWFTLLAVLFVACFTWELIKSIASYFSQPKPLKNVENTLPPVEIILSPEEKQIRSKWLRSVFMLLLGNLAQAMVFYFFIAYHRNVEAANDYFMQNLNNIVKFAISSSLIFFFAYKKFGTKWLGFFLLISPLINTMRLISDIALAFQSATLTTAQRSLVLMIDFGILFLFVYFWIHCTRLYKLNRSIKKRKIGEESIELESTQAV